MEFLFYQYNTVVTRMATDIDMCTYSEYTDVSYEIFSKMNKIQTQKISNNSAGG